MAEWIELPIVWVNKAQDEVEKDLENNVEYTEDDYQIDWTCFRLSEIMGFNGSTNETESTLRMKNGEMFRVALTYTELKTQILTQE